MAGFIMGVDRGQSVLFPDRLDDWIADDSLVRVVDFFVEELDLHGLGGSVDGVDAPSWRHRNVPM